MITVYKANVKQVDAESYKKFTETLNLYSLICPKCKHHDFQKHGYYTRKVKYRKHSVTLRILRVKCMSCKSTHAVLLYFIVPYSQYALEVHLKALQSDFLNTLISVVNAFASLDSFALAIRSFSLLDLEYKYFLCSSNPSVLFYIPNLLRIFCTHFGVTVSTY